MKFDGLKLALLLINTLSTFIVWMRERELLKAGADAEAMDSLRRQAEDENKALDALTRIRVILAGPGGVRQHDPDERVD
jgi:hypothetical protein